jgi:hypothetical protein
VGEKGNGITEVCVADREKLPSEFRVGLRSFFVSEAWRWNGTKGKYIEALE